LDFIGVDDASDIGVCKEGFREFVTFLLLCPVVHFLKSGLGPDDKAAKMTARG